MNHKENLGFFLVLVVGVALVAADNAIVTMERDGDRKLDELMEDDQLLFVTKPRRLHKQQERPSQDVTTAPPPIPTEHPLHVEERHLLQDENLLPAFRNMSRWYQNEKGRLFDPVTYSNQVHQLTVTTPPLGVEEIDAFEEDDLLPVDLHFDLSRDRRSVGSGDSVVEVTARITLSEPFAVSIANEIRRRNQVATQLRRFFVVDFDVGVETVNVLSIEDDGDGNSIYNFTVTFDGPSDLRGVSYALERLWRSETLIGEYTIIISPTICNSVDVFVNVICVLCDPNRPCVNGVCGEFLEQSSVDPAAFGISEADIRLARQDDVISSQVEIPDGMPFFNERVTKLYVGDNGGVSLNSPYNPYGLENIQSALKNYLCIYCDDFDNSFPSSNIWYQAYPAGKVWATNMLGRVTAEVRAHTEYTRFKASWACVITWKDIPEYLSSSGTMGNSFQMILVKDGMRTFLLFYFIEIKATRFFREQAVHGYKRQGSSRDVYEMLYSRRTLNSNQAVFEKPNMQFVKGNTGFVGKWIFKIGEIVVPNYPAMCFDWYLQNRPFRSNFRLRAQIMGINTCPCWRNVFMFTAAFLPTPALRNQARFCSEMQAWFGLDTYECCYDAFGRFISQYPEAGGYHRYSSLIDPARHKLQDSDPRDWCCVKSNLCRLYEDVRPVSRCWWNRPILIIIFIVGDPHFVSLDGKKFTYNGIGETRLVELEPADKSFTFKLQCRTAQALSDSGEKVNASIFSAFAAEQQSDTLGSGKIHVQLNKQRTKMVIYFNDLDVTNDFYSDENFVRRQNNVTASRKNETRIDFSFTSTGIVVAVRFSSGTLAQGVVIPEKYKGMTTGLLGNYNGNDTDDFKSPDGNNFSADSTDKQLFPFGKSWAVPDDGSSVMHYAPGETTKTFTDDDFIPLYTEDFTPEQRAAAVSVCGADNEQCIYDYMVTQNNALATFTKSQIQDTQDNAKILANRAPSLTGTTHLNVEVGKIASFTFIGNDADNDQVSYITVDSPTSGFTFDQSSGNGTFIPPNTNLVKLRVAAKDTKEAQSSVLSVKIRLCPGCANGNCDFNTPVAAITSESDSFFQIVSCICKTGYTGADCSEDKNGCDGNPCGIGRTCTDNDPTYEETSGKPYNCSACMPGYKEATGSSKCENVDECATNNGNCPANSNCTDQPGSYKCTCNAGFRQNSAGTCDDIDECVEHLSDCSHTCTNSAGGFTCGCHTGFTLNADGKQCDASDVPNSCPSTCSAATEICANNGSDVPICLCKAGYEKKTGATQCTDIDECSLSLCAQGCTNSEGSYTCSCFTGFTLGPDKLDCLRCSFPKWGDDCSSTCECQGRASACDPVQGCVCLPGWTGSNCSTDVNECTANPDICGSNSVCTNNDGSYTCTCNSGFVKNGTECMDLNECEADSDTTLCPSNSMCMNVLGNYTCTCNAGYTKTGVVCIDVDECATGQAACEHNCLNKDGSYNCYCNAGYTLNDDRKTCSKDPDQVDPCADLTNKVCGHYCEAVNKQAVCRCKRGYYLADDNITCLDVDECGSSTLNLCTDKSSCSNTPGSYTCACPVGQKLKNDGRTCADCDAFHWGVNCSSECTCSDLGTESCDRIRGCVCKPGWTGADCDLDVDECSSQVTCPANADCDNTPGSYRCVCRTGYRKSAGQSTCDEINECASSSDNVCDHECHDTIGSYYCTCKSGFILEGKGTCKDIDECSTNSHDCQQVCRNTIGSFTCTCRDGFEFADSARKTCTPVAGRSLCRKTCDVTNGGCLDPINDTCFCNSGYQLNADAFTCDDIDECKPNSSCSVSCTNTAGSFICSCNPGQKLAADKITCEACEPGKWGPNCANTCTCDASNSVSCNAVDGTCTCREGWKGTTCTDDIPECTNTPTICGNNGICNEKNGSHSCTCSAGYIRSNDACTPCTSTKWGDNCANACTCDFANTESCNSVTGKCTCKTGWTGTNCTDDVNECTNTASPVCTNVHETCTNTQGSFVCGCTSGYQRSADNSGCIDLNECLISSLNNCTFQCDNTVGSFSCSCPAGYIGSGNNCEANFVSYVILITLDTDKSAIVSDKSSDAYKKLQDDISAAIDAIIKPEVGEAHLKTVMGTLTTGSVIAPAELRVDKSKTDNELGLLAKSLEELAEIRSLDIDGTSTPVTNITFKGIPIIKNHTVCDVYKIVRAFGNDEICEVDADGIPIHRKLSEGGTNIPLIVGVSMASLILLILVLLLLLYFCCYRRRSKRAPSEERDNRAFQSAFVGSVPTKGFFGASRYMMYSPHTLSSAASQASEDSSGRRPRKFNTNDSGLPRWNSSPDLTRRVPDDIDRNDAASNFSWGNLFTRLGQFEVPRPTVNTTRNKFFDSNA